MIVLFLSRAYAPVLLLQDKANRQLSSTLKIMASNPQPPNSYRYIGGRVPKDKWESVVHIIIDATVTKIDEKAFLRCKALKSISLPNGLKEIGRLAFHWCESLESILLPDGLERIGKWGFKDCKSLFSVNIPSGLKEIGMWAFSGCNSLSSVHFPDGFERINEDAFMGCKSLSSIHLPNGLKEIGKCAFKGCTSLSSIHLPFGLESVGEGAFMDCISLSSIHLPDGFEGIEERAFEGCTSLSSIHLSDGLENISYGAFKNCTLLSSAHLPDGLNAIGAEAFCGCTSLSSIQLPDRLEKIGKGAFDGCTRLLIIAISRETTIGGKKIRNCKALGDKNDATEPFRVDQLKTRFNDLPLHLACYKANEQEIKDSLTKETALQTDEYNVTPLHILASNHNATKGMIRLVADQYQDAITSTAGAFQISPLHFASINPGHHVIQFLPYLTKGRTRTPGQGKLGCTLQNMDSQTPTVLSLSTI